MNILEISGHGSHLAVFILVKFCDFNIVPIFSTFTTNVVVEIF